MLELDIPIDSNLLVYTGDTEHQAEVWDVYRAQPGAELRSAVSSLQSAVPSHTTRRLSRWGVWRPQYGLEVLQAHKWEIRRDLTGVVFHTSTTHEPPYVDVAYVKDKSDYFPTGYKVNINLLRSYIYTNKVSNKKGGEGFKFILRL